MDSAKLGYSDSSDGTLANLRGTIQSPREISSTVLLRETVEWFDRNPRHFAVLVIDGPTRVHPLSREWLAEQLARPYVRELFINKPLTGILSLGIPHALELAQATAIPQAIEKALARPHGQRYQPLVVVSEDGSRWLLDIYSLLLEQCKVQAATLIELESQRVARQAAEAERRRLQDQLITSSREAGRAEVATGVLHNVGNVLNSLNVSASVIAKTLQQSKLTNLGKSIAMFEEHREDLPQFLTTDERGKRLPAYLVKLQDALNQEQSTIRQEMVEVESRLEHIRRVVSLQQSHAKGSTLRESVRPADLMEDALRVNIVSFERHNVSVTREFAPITGVMLDKHKVLQILINLISNAKEAVKSCPPDRKRISLKIHTVQADTGDRIVFEVIDSGLGIPPENLTRIFAHGFTTRTDGHGFGLHSAANAAREMEGSLTGHSNGAGTGAAFMLSLPLQVATPASPSFQHEEKVAA